MPIKRTLTAIGHRSVETVWRVGFASRFFWAILQNSASSFKRLQLTIKEVFSSGVMSLVIILVARMIVVMLLVFQVFETLKL